jgi:ATP-dependent DNA helicase DinG
MLVKIFGLNGLLSKGLSNFEWRPSQLKMAIRVFKAIEEEMMLVVEAGPGTGKTFAYLIPAILNSKKTIISTGTKGLQDQLFYRDIPLIEKILGKSLDVVYLKGRRNYLCILRFRDALRNQMLLEQTQQMEILKDWLKRTIIGDVAEAAIPPEWPGWLELTASTEQCLGQNCPFYSECFITKARIKAQKAQLLIVNHHLFMADLALRDRGCGQVIPRAETVIFDEAHQLEDIVSEYFGFQVSDYRIAQLIRDIYRLYGKELENQVAKVIFLLQERNKRFFNIFAHVEGKQSLNQVISSSLLKGEMQILREALEKLEEIIYKTNSFEVINEHLRKRMKNIKNSLDFICILKDPDYAYWVENKKRSIAIGCSPLRVDLILREKFYPPLKGVIFTSATLDTGDNFRFFKTRLGLSIEIETLMLACSFDWRKQSLLYLPPKMPDPNENCFLEAAQKEIIKILNLSKGRALILFTSIKNMQEIYKNVAPKISFRTLLQGETSPKKILEIFKKDIHSVLFATATFWEGIDVPGEALSCLIIDRLPFAVPEDPIIKARLNVLKKEKKNPFWQYQLPQAIITLKQGLGRLIRHSHDRGLLTIFDPRLYTKSYGQYFLKNLPSCQITQDIKDVEMFFKTH